MLNTSITLQRSQAQPISNAVQICSSSFRFAAFILVQDDDVEHASSHCETSEGLSLNHLQVCGTKIIFVALNPALTKASLATCPPLSQIFF